MASSGNFFLTVVVRHIRTINSLKNVQSDPYFFWIKWEVWSLWVCPEASSIPTPRTYKKVSCDYLPHTRCFSIELLNQNAKLNLSQTHPVTLLSLTYDLHQKIKAILIKPGCWGFWFLYLPDTGYLLLRRDFRKWHVLIFLTWQIPILISTST